MEKKMDEMEKRSWTTLLRVEKKMEKKMEEKMPIGYLYKMEEKMEKKMETVASKLEKKIIEFIDQVAQDRVASKNKRRKTEEKKSGACESDEGHPRKQRQ